LIDDDDRETGFQTKVLKQGTITDAAAASTAWLQHLDERRAAGFREPACRGRSTVIATDA
jgi:hypothetical protein